MTTNVFLIGQLICNSTVSDDHLKNKLTQADRLLSLIQGIGIQWQFYLVEN